MNQVKTKLNKNLLFLAEKKTMKTKTLKILLIVLLILALVAVGVVLYLERNAGKLADRYFRQVYAESELSQVYDIEYDNIEVSLLSGKVNLVGLKVMPALEFFSSKLALRLKHPVVFEIEADRISVTGLLKNLSINPGDISVKAVDIQRPAIKMITHLTEDEKQMTRKKDVPSVHDSINLKSTAPHLSLSRFAISKGSFEMIDRLRERSNLKIGEISLDINNIDLATDNVDLANVLKEIGQISLRLGNIVYPTPDGFYELNLKELGFDLQQAALTAKGFNLIPKYDKREFGRLFGKQTDRMDLGVEHVKIEGIDIPKWVENSAVWIKSVHVDGVDFDIYRDKNVPRDFTVFPKLPHQALAALEMEVNVEVIHINNAGVWYQELILGSDTAGDIPLKNLQATVRNATNVESVQKAAGTMQWEVSGEIFGEGHFEVLVDFAANHEDGEFSFEGKVNEMDMRLFNHMLVPNEHIRIDDGRIISKRFTVNAGRDHSTGEMMLEYEDLKITILKELEDHQLRERALLSAVANTAIRMFNRDKLDATAGTAHIYFERDKNKSIFNYMVKSLLSGIKASVVPGQNISPEERLEQMEKKSRRNSRRKS